jgi:hypothetical protein
VAAAVAAVVGIAPSAGASPAGGASATATARTDTATAAAASCRAPLHTYQYTNYTGGYAKFCSSDMKLDNNRFNNGGKVNDHIESVKNLTQSCTWDLWQNYYNRGHHTTMSPRHWDPNLSNNSVGFHTSSLHRYCP